ncbi:MAG: signal peptidase II [Candidatus Peribacteraceae bacterium]|nr:signal peptidase II [Candidatus Peribacteraceae bacterium]
MLTIRDRHPLLIAAVVALALSLLGKFLADALLTGRIAIIGEWVGLVLAFNPGIAFGLTFAPAVQTILIIIALLLVVWVALKDARSPLAQAGFGLIIGGALGNLLDRAQDGLVTDMFQVGTFPIFNVADSCITIGAVVLLLAGLFQKR